MKDLEANLTALEKLVPGKPICQGCYTYDSDACRPLPVDLMQQQTQTGLHWLREGRTRGMIFLATPNVDVGLEAVDWTRRLDPPMDRHDRGRSREQTLAGTIR